MGAYPVKGIVFDVLCLPDVIADPVSVKRMPCDCCAQVIKNTCLIHHNLARHDLLRRTAIYPNCSWHIRGRHIFLQRTRRPAYGRSQKIVPAGMAYSRKGIIFRQESYNRFPVAPVCSKSSGNPDCSPGNRKSLLFQKVRQTPRRQDLLIGSLRMLKDKFRCLNKLLLMPNKPICNNIVHSPYLLRTLLHPRSLMPLSILRRMYS